MVLSFMLTGCVTSMECPTLKPPEATGAAHRFPFAQEELAGVVASPPDCRIDLAEARLKVNQYETKLQQDGRREDNALAELARLCFMLGEFGEKSDSKQYFEKGRHYAEYLSRKEPTRVEGHYWLAMNLAGLAQIGGAGRALRLIPVIVDKLEVAMAIDETYDQAGPHRVLGRIQCEAPAWPLSEGKIDQSLANLRAAVEIAPENSTNHLFLAETLYQLGKTEEACRELERVLACSCHAVCSASPRNDCEEALHLLKQYREGEDPGAFAKNGERHLAGNAW